VRDERGRPVLVLVDQRPWRYVRKRFAQFVSHCI